MARSQSIDEERQASLSPIKSSSLLGGSWLHQRWQWALDEKSSAINQCWRTRTGKKTLHETLPAAMRVCTFSQYVKRQTNIEGAFHLCFTLPGEQSLHSFYNKDRPIFFSIRGQRSYRGRGVIYKAVSYSSEYLDLPLWHRAKCDSKSPAAQTYNCFFTNFKFSSLVEIVDMQLQR